MPQELQNLLVTLNIIIALMFVVVTTIVVMAYLYETKKSREYERLIKQLIQDGRYKNWKDENKILIMIEKYSLWVWALTLIFAGPIDNFLITGSQILLTTSRIIFGIVLVLLTAMNIFTKRLLRRKIVDAITNINQ